MGKWGRNQGGEVIQDLTNTKIRNKEAEFCEKIKGVSVIWKFSKKFVITKNQILFEFSKKENLRPNI